MAKTVGFDTSELSEYSRELLDLAMKTMPKEIDRFLKAEAKKIKTKTASIAKSTVNKKTGNFLEGIKVGKTYDFGGYRAIRTYAGKPAYHAHLLEYGHEIRRPHIVNGRFVSGKLVKVGKRTIHDGVNTGKRTRAFKIFEQAKIITDAVFTSDVETMIDNLLAKKGLS